MPMQRWDRDRWFESEQEFASFAFRVSFFSLLFHTIDKCSFFFSHSLCSGLSTYSIQQIFIYTFIFCLFRYEEQLIRIGDLPFRAKNKNIYSYFYYLLIDHISFHALPCFLLHSLCVAQWSIDVECILLSSVAIYIATDCVDAFLSPHISIDCGQKKNNNNGNLIPLEIGSFPFYPDCNIYSRSMFGVRLDIFYMYEYWKLFELKGKSISLTSMARTTHARKCLWIVQITTMRAINHSLSERLKCKHNNTCTHTHTFFPQQNYFYCYWWHYYLGLG